MSVGKIDRIFVGADRIAANGDFANKIGTYLAVNAKFHKFPSTRPPSQHSTKIAQMAKKSLLSKGAR